MNSQSQDYELGQVLQRYVEDIARNPMHRRVAGRIGTLLLMSKSEIGMNDSIVLGILAIYNNVLTNCVNGKSWSCHFEPWIHTTIAQVEKNPANVAPYLLDVVYECTKELVQVLYSLYPVVIQSYWPSSSSFAMPMQSLLAENVPESATTSLTTSMKWLRTLSLKLIQVCLDLGTTPVIVTTALAATSNLACIPGEDNEALIIKELQLHITRSISYSQIPQLLAPLFSAIDQAKAQVFLPFAYDCIVGKQLTHFLQVVPFMDADNLFSLGLLGITHYNIDINLSCHRSIRMLILQRRPNIKTPEMAAVYMKHLLNNYPTTTSMEILTTSLGYILSVDNEGVTRFCGIQLQNAIRERLKVSRDDALPLVRLLFELIKIVPLESTAYLLRIVEQVVFLDPGLQTTLFDAISTACEASRRTILTEWYLSFYQQLSTAPSML
ncbi:hypothetical protein THRCLA_21333 [Thraustotheca clavata]|uniref:Uncharacterized protein n=1 Tax=Thraustotheca clavata TaxID=74557 RepID=A0A1V9ZY92_9STRA|nr:hypothetical protein THRCLA_21333 [Thraustotheca clavata]